MIPAQTINHDDKSYTPGITKGWSSFFKNSDETNCPISSCSLLEPGCSQPYTKTSLAVSSSAPFVVERGLAVTAGVAEKVCIKCKNKDQEITSDNFSVTQTGACLATLSASGAQFTAPKLEYGKSVVVVQDPV